MSEFNDILAEALRKFDEAFRKFDETPHWVHQSGDLYECPHCGAIEHVCPEWQFCPVCGNRVWVKK